MAVKSYIAGAIIGVLVFGFANGLQMKALVFSLGMIIGLVIIETVKLLRKHHND